MYPVSGRTQWSNVPHKRHLAARFVRRIVELQDFVHVMEADTESCIRYTVRSRLVAMNGETVYNSNAGNMLQFTA